MKDPWEKEIKVFIDSVKPLKFHLDSSLPKGSKDNDYVFDNNDRPGFILNYVLQNTKAGADYFFPDDAKDAMYSATGTTCPTEPGQWPQFKATGVKPGNKILVVRNLNQHGFEGQFSYTLRVTQTPHETDPDCLPLDPGGLNNNGLSRSDTSFVTYAAVGVATIAVVVALTETFHITNFFR